MNINIISNKNIIYSCWNKAFFVGMSLFLIGFCWNQKMDKIFVLEQGYFVPTKH